MLAALLGVFSLFAAAPAQAQTPLVQWAQTAYSITETDADQSLVLTININPVIPGPHNRALGVITLGTSTATRSDDWDFSAPCSTLPHSVSTVTCTLTIKGDDTYEESETIELRLSAGSQVYNIGSNAITTVTIFNDDAPPPTVSLSASPNPVREGKEVTVTATLSEALSSNVTIPVTITDNTAESDDHGTLINITINSGSTSGMGTITTKQDGDTEDETFTVSLGTLPSSVRAGIRDSVTVTITDQTRILPWSSTLTVKQHGHLQGCNVEKLTAKNDNDETIIIGWPSSCPDALTEDTLTYNGESYRIMRLTSEGGIPPHKQIVLGFDKQVPGEMIGVLCLRVDGSPLCLRDARDQNKIIITRKNADPDDTTLGFVPNLYVFGWQKTPIAWTVEQEVPLRFSDDGSGRIGGGTSGGPPGSSGASGALGALGPPPGSSGSGGGVGASGGPSGPPVGGGGGGGGALPPSGSSDEPPPEDDELSALCSQEDRENLERFYETTTGEEPWDENENWNSEEPLNQWYGVETDEDGNVVSLRLSENNLSGDMPARELLCFSELKELALWGNDLPGEVPEELVLRVERAVLRDIAEMLDINPEWFENYEDPYDFEGWHTGVTTDEKGRVTELVLTGEVPGTLISQLRKLRVITISSENGGCALSPKDDSSAFSLFLLALLVFAARSRKRARD